MSKFVCWFTKLTGWLPFVLTCRPTYYFEDEKEQDRRIKGSAIVMPDHHDIFDFAAMMFAFWGRDMHCVVAELMFNKSKLFGWFLRRLGCIRVDRNEQDFTFLTKSCEVLGRGGVVEIYPESRIPVAGEESPLPFKPSVVQMALESGAPVIPVVTNGKYFSKTPLRVLIGKPIDVRELYDESLSEAENIAVITTMLREKIIRLKDELQRKTTQKIKEKATEQSVL